MNGRHYINNNDVFTKWGIIITSIDGLTFPKRKVAYSKSWDYASGKDEILGGYESRELTLSIILLASSSQDPRAKVERFLRDISAMGEFVLYDVSRKEGVVCAYSNEQNRTIYNDIANGTLSELKVRLINNYPCSKTFLSDGGQDRTVSFVFDSNSLPVKIWWGNGTTSLAYTSSFSKALPAANYKIVVAANTNWEMVTSVINAQESITI